MVETAVAADGVVRAEVSRSERRCGRRHTPSRSDVSPDAPGPNGTGTRRRLPPALCDTRTPALPRQCAHSSRPAPCAMPADHTKSTAAAAAAAAASGARTEWCPVRSHTCCYFPTRIGGRRCQGRRSSEQCSRSQRWFGCCSGCSPSMPAGPQCGRRRLRWMATSATTIVGPRSQAGRGEATAASPALAAAGTQASNSSAVLLCFAPSSSQPTCKD